MSYNEIGEETQAHDKDKKLAFDSHVPSTETKALLDVELNECELMIHRTYFSPQCQYFYIGFISVSCLLLLITLLLGSKLSCKPSLSHLAANPIIIVFDFLLNAVMITDFSFRVKLLGFRKFL